MKAKERRERILDIVKNSDVPVPANKLASEFDVSRQIIAVSYTHLTLPTNREV